MGASGGPRYPPIPIWEKCCYIKVELGNARRKPSVFNIKRLSLADAQKLIKGAKRKAKRIDVPMCIAVADESGNLIAFERMDGAKILSVGLSAARPASGCSHSMGRTPSTIRTATTNIMPPANTSRAPCTLTCARKDKK